MDLTLTHTSKIVGGMGYLTKYFWRVRVDEPTTFLDASHQIEVLDLLTDLNRERGTTIVMVLHDLNLAARYADELVAMRAGRVHSFGRPRDIVSVDFVREVFGLDSRVDRRSGVGRTARTALWPPPRRRSRRH